MTRTERALVGALRHMIEAYQDAVCVEQTGAHGCTGSRHAASCYASPNSPQIRSHLALIRRVERRGYDEQ